MVAVKFNIKRIRILIVVFVINAKFDTANLNWYNEYEIKNKWKLTTIGEKYA